jgi:hypothetical protein
VSNKTVEASFRAVNVDDAIVQVVDYERNKPIERNCPLSVRIVYRRSPKYWQVVQHLQNRGTSLALVGQWYFLRSCLNVIASAK